MGRHLPIKRSGAFARLSHGGEDFRGDPVAKRFAGGPAFEFPDGAIGEVGDLVANGAADMRADDRVLHFPQPGIRRATLKLYLTEDKIGIISGELCGDDSIAGLGRREDIARSMYYAGVVRSN